MMTLSIVSHRQANLVEQLLADLARLASPLVSAIVITRNVPEAPIAVPPSLTSIAKVIDNSVADGFGANHNAAFEHCDTPLFVVLNPDIRLPRDPFDVIASTFGAVIARPLEAGAVAMVAPRITSPDGHDEDAARKLITPWGLIRHRLLGHERVAARDFDWLAGMFVVLRSDAFRALGGFDPRYFMYCEDFDLCARVRLAGWAIIRSDAISVVHAAQRASHRSARHLAWHIASLAKMWLSPVFWRYRHTLRRST